MEKNIRKVGSASGPEEGNRLLASIREDIPNIQKTLLETELSLQSNEEKKLDDTALKPDINLLQQDICSMDPIDQVSPYMSLVDNTCNKNYTIFPNGLGDVNQYRQCGSL